MKQLPIEDGTDFGIPLARSTRVGGIVDGRVNTGLRKFRLKYTYEHHSGVDSELVARVGKFGLGAGSEFRRAHGVAFNLAGEFPELVPPST